MLGGLFFIFFKSSLLHIYTLTHLILSFLIILILGAIITYLITYRITLLIFFPIEQVINQVNKINIHKEVNLLEEPKEESALKELIPSFNHMLLRIKEQYEYQNAFFSSASHELRTPLTIMLTQLQILLKSKSQSDEVKQAYTNQIKEVKHLIKMVNDFLLMGEINNNSIQLLHEECNITDILSNLVEDYKTKIQERNTTLKISYYPIEANYSIIADESKLKIILANLLNNAIKYSKKNTNIQISLSKKEDKIIFNISNIIRKDIHPQVTDLNNKFYHSKPLNGEGSGLGLWICKQLTDLQDFELFFTIKNQTFFEATLIM